ncbi:hypothetical protein BH23ACT10_BH23ACT10_33250 [soil metagenome]
MKKVVKPENAAGQRADPRALAEINDLIDDGVQDAASMLAWEVQRSSPGDPAVWLLLARIDYLRERYAAAIYAARMATRLAPSSPDAWFALASTAATRSRWHAEGLDAALQATALAPDRPKNWTVLAQLQLATGTGYDAAVAAERAVKVDPDYRGGHLMLGEIALVAGEWEHAEAAFRRALALDPADRDARDGLVEALEAQDRDPDAELAGYGAPAARDDEPLTRRLLGASGARVADRVLGSSSRRLALAAIGSCLLAGLILGLLLPGVGVVRGVVGAVALVLMWVAVGPTRTEPQASQVIAAPLAPYPFYPAYAFDASDAAGGSQAAPAHADVPVAAQANGRQRADDTRTAVTVAAPAADDVEVDMPDDPAELAVLSRTRLAVSDLELAHAAASRLQAVAPGSIEAHRALGAVALAEHDYERARTHYRKVLELEPLDQEAHERLALVGDETQRSGLRLPLRRLRGRP